MHLQPGSLLKGRSGIKFASSAFGDFPVMKKRALHFIGCGVFGRCRPLQSL